MELNIVLLNIIIAVQNRLCFERSNSMLVSSLNEEQRYDSYGITERYFKDINRELVDKAGIKQNRDTFDKIISYQIPDEAESVEYSELGQFRF